MRIRPSYESYIYLGHETHLNWANVYIVQVHIQSGTC